MARRNIWGEIEIDLDPYANLPRPLSSELERFILGTDHDEALNRVDAIQLLLEDWDDLDDEEIPTWIAEHGDRDFSLITAEDGSWRATDTSEPQALGAREKVVLPQQVIELFCEEVLRQDNDTMVARRESIRDLVGEWLGLLVDDEKLVGHLLLVHNAQWPLNGDQDELLALHGRYHSAT
jgi:hypothetical protein